MEELVHSAWSMVPFGLMLLVIAIAPLVAEKFWDKNVNKLIVSLALGVPTAVCLILGGMADNFEHQMLNDYLPFVVLLLALYTITGGIHLSGDIRATPAVNTVFLTLGWIFASFMGTTGAAMLLIRPLISTNKQRKYNVHTILFFIALVANCGGLLTPLGDPPLFMLFLRGASFTWFLTMLPEWLFVGVFLLGLYFVVDTVYYKKESSEMIQRDTEEREPMRVHGGINFVLLLGVVLSVAFINEHIIPAMGDAQSPIWIRYMREIVLLSLTFLSLYGTPKKVRYGLNKYTWGPIIEVGIVFLGIFTTMTPAMAYLQAHAAELGLTETWQFYYATGALSSFLDNTPTAVAMHSVGMGLSAEQMAAIGGSMVAGVPDVLLRAISLGAVMFGAMTYIGNGPNFMVKAIAEESGIRMPSFFSYMIRFSLTVLLPTYIIAQLLFL